MASGAPAPAHPARHRTTIQSAQNLRRVVEIYLSATPVSSAAQFTLLPASINTKNTAARPAFDGGAHIGAAVATVPDQHVCAAALRALYGVRPAPPKSSPPGNRQLRCAPSANRAATASCESRTMRSSGRLRGKPVRSVSRQSSARTVPIPVRMASGWWRSLCTWARAVSLVIQPRLSSGAAILPSSVSAVFSVTSGRRCA